MHSNWSCCPEQLMNKGYNLHIVCEYNTPKSVSHYNPQNVPQPIKMATLNYNSQPATSSMCINWKTKHDGPATPTPLAHRSYGRGPEPIGGSNPLYWTSQCLAPRTHYTAHHSHDQVSSCAGVPLDTHTWTTNLLGWERNHQDFKEVSCKDKANGLPPHHTYDDTVSS